MFLVAGFTWQEEMVAKKRNRASKAVFAMLRSRQSNSKLERKDQLSELGMDGSQT